MHSPLHARRGLAMVAVLLVLVALFVLSAPFLVTVRNADQASGEAADRATLRITLDAAARHAAVKLAASHPSVDPTPYFDDASELAVSSVFPPDFLPTSDPHQALWGIAAEDLAGRIDLASASPHVLANLIGGTARLTSECKQKDGALEISDAGGLLNDGVVCVDNEVIGYAELGPTKLAKLSRGLLVKPGADDKPSSCGPTPPTNHDIGAFVIDQRAWALCEWRIASEKFREYQGIEQVREAKDFVLGTEFGREAFLALERTTTPHGHVRAGERWQRAARVTGDSEGEPQYGCSLPVDDLRWFNPGTTVWITDGDNDELAMVRGSGGGKLVLSEPLQHPFKAWRTIVAPLARTPVNVNTASPEVLTALWTNLKLRGKTARITGGEAQQLVDLAIVSRPFTGFEDFLRRLVLPAGGLDELPADAEVRPAALEELSRQSKLDAQGAKQLQGFIDADDARALYKCALNANDGELEFATMPLCFTSRDVYELELRAALDAPSGIERAHGVRVLDELIVPQRDLLSVWTRQEDFDEAPRLDLAAAAWMTGPNPTSRPDALFGSVASARWPTRARAQLGPHDTAPSIDPLADEQTKVYTFAKRADDDGWAQLAPYREDAAARRASYALHFDDESKSLEGHYLPDGTAPLELEKLGWNGAGKLMSGMAFSMWIQPRELADGAVLLDVGGQFSDSDRLTLLFEKGDLVLRVLDGAGDHPQTTFKERAEIHFPLSGEGPGMPRETWSHVEITVDGTRPDQMTLLVDGRRAPKTYGLTRLVGAVTGESDTLQVESTDGFPDKCVLRIGNELIEAEKKGPKAFRARYQSTGENAGFGGRIARELFSGSPELNTGISKAIDHPSGSTVQLYGYSLPIFSNVPNVGSTLRDELPLFAVARVVGTVVSGSEKVETQMEAITFQGDLFSSGNGFDTKGDDLEGLLLETVDPGRSVEDTMGAFSKSGGYAAILGVPWQDGNGQPAKDMNGARVGGVEVVRYSGYEGKTLKLVERGGAGLKRMQGDGVSPFAAGRASFLLYYDYPVGWTSDGTWEALNTRLLFQTFIIPISVPVRAAGGVTGFESPAEGSAFAQITHGGGESGKTEWVRYDEISSEGHLVRDDSLGLLEANGAAHPGIDPGRPPPPVQGGGGGGGGGFALRSLLPSLAPRALATPPPAIPARQQTGGQSFWFHAIGAEEDQDFPVARAINSQFQFRGVLGTYQHEHSAGTMVLPVFRTSSLDETQGYPGRFDAVMFMSSFPSEPGFPGVVQHAHRPYEFLAYDWQEGGDINTPQAVAAASNLGQTGFQISLTHVALDAPLAVPFAAVPIGDAEHPIDSRLLTRMVLFPSGELPRQVENGQLGGEAAKNGKGGKGAVPSAVVDEALFYPNFGVQISGMPGQFVLARSFGESAKAFEALDRGPEFDTVRTTLGDIGYKLDALATMPEHGGLLRIGDELLCYDSYDKAKFVFTLPPGGRGLSGTEVQPHRPGEGITYVGALPLAILGAKVGADDASLPLLEFPPGFPQEGTVWIDGELVHYTRVQQRALEMPRASREPGEMDAKGPGLFRGRFGTPRADHDAGTPVILFPFRYWDRWADQADAPEMAYYQLSCEQPDAYWRRAFWKVGDSGQSGPQLAVLQRTNQATPWDARPEGDNGLRLFFDGKIEGEGNPMGASGGGVQTDRVEWRVFVRHLQGSFDANKGLSHGWKTSPRLELFGVDYMGPGRTLSRVDR
ncbi:MAG: hypothetical protein EXS08_01495 [Planctomycetes bacterium]|nr:hypothetical protein [Planctomycetota bacterium]